MRSSNPFGIIDDIFSCPECGEEIDEDKIELYCPFCGEHDVGDGFFICECCETLFDYEEELWVCEFCNNGEEETETTYIEKTNEEEIDTKDYCPDCGEVLDDPYNCESCGWPDNQGWLGEHYG